MSVLAMLASPAALGEGRAAAVIDGTMLTLDDGTVVRLSGLDAPDPRASAALKELVAGHGVALDDDGAPTDRHGRRIAQVRRDDGLWLQGELLRRGLARVRGGADNRGRLREMLALEAAARAERRGLWAEAGWAVRAAGENVGPAGSFQIVEGTVFRADRIGGRIYLNFSGDWRRDFTVVVPTRDRRSFVAAGLDPEALAGRRLRVRGYVTMRNGPEIEATHPEQMEILE